MSMIGEVYLVPVEKAQSLTTDPSGVHALIEELQGSEQAISLEKSWHGLHFVLTGTAWEGNPPLNFIAGGGVPLGDEDVGYGPGRLLAVPDVRALDAALDEISDADFIEKLDPVRLTEADIYPQIWDEPLEDLQQEYAGYFNEFRSLVKRAAKTGQALMIAIM